jgi:hypothetical protein
LSLTYTEVYAAPGVEEVPVEEPNSTISTMSLIGTVVGLSALVIGTTFLLKNKNKKGTDSLVIFKKGFLIMTICREKPPLPSLITKKESLVKLALFGRTAWPDSETNYNGDCLPREKLLEFNLPWLKKRQPPFNTLHNEEWEKK